MKKFMDTHMVRITLVDRKTWENADLYFRLYDTPLAHKWLKHFTKLKEGNHLFREKSFRVSSSITNETDEVGRFNRVVDRINAFYDRKIDRVIDLTNEVLNELHECYEVYGERLQEKLDQKWWNNAWKILTDTPAADVWPGVTFNEDMHYAFLELNELIHTYELRESTDFGTFKRKDNAQGIMIISHDPRTDYELTDEDYTSITPFLKFGHLCLGYNTLGKNLMQMVLDEDIEGIKRGPVPQMTWSDELYVHLFDDADFPGMVSNYKKKWDKLQVTEKTGASFGNWIENKDGYLVIGEMYPHQRMEIYGDETENYKIDFNRFNSIYDISIVNETQAYKKDFPEARVPAWKKPNPLNGKIIDRIDNKRSSIVTWILNDICNYSCRYCPPTLHNGKNYRYTWEEIKPFVNHLFKVYNNPMFSISGGEPTLSPFFPTLVQYIYAKGGYTGITTNLARSERYIADNFKFLTYACCSFHPAFEFLNKTDQNFIEKVKVVETVTCADVRVMMDPLHWDETVNFIERLKIETNANIEIVFIEDQYGNTPKKLTEIGYTDKQLQFINDFKVIQCWDPKFLSTQDYYRSPTGPITVTYEDGATESFGSPQKYINDGQTTFLNYHCKIGAESLFIHQNGNIRRGNCPVGGFVGNISKWKEIDWRQLRKAVICSVMKCHCGADVNITKWR